ncbi:MAG: aminoacyl-tRNA hydrolase [Planctomyces sp.]|nr:aminoacyl-tRNA hydrolase [Planctomyces sp.]MBA4120843.1 aminoacyl-tRNA hydrolase [Isosphaera sp.]
MHTADGPAGGQPSPERAPGSGGLTVGAATVPAGAIGWEYARSGGPGGQNVNKVSSRATLRVPIDAIAMPEDARVRLGKAAGRRLTLSRQIVITSQSERSQASNRWECLERLRLLLESALVAPAPRKATKPTAGSRRRRLESKRLRADRKSKRRGPSGESE